jgi:hypothetical protein
MCFYDYKNMIEKCGSQFELHNILVMLDSDTSVNDYDRVCITRLVKFHRDFLDKSARNTEGRCK